MSSDTLDLARCSNSDFVPIFGISSPFPHHTPDQFVISLTLYFNDNVLDLGQKAFVYLYITKNLLLYQLPSCRL